MKIASVADVKARLSAYLKESQQGPVVVTRNGKAVAVLLAVTDEDELERLVLAHSPKFQALLDREFKGSGVFFSDGGEVGEEHRRIGPKRLPTPLSILYRSDPFIDPFIDPMAPGELSFCGPQGKGCEWTVNMAFGQTGDMTMPS